MLDALLDHIALTEILSYMLVLGGLAIAWRSPLVADGVFRAVERFGTSLANKKGLALAAVAAAVIVVRLALLAWIPVPVPRIHDEFSYLLAGDTFAHGRLTNPPHPLWIFFDTFHVNSQPTYMSKYPPAQGAVLAVGQLLGHPWIGVLLSAAGMCAAVLWMLQGWLPPRWALLGGALVALRLGIFSYWMNSYWGGAVAAIGGALVVGALPRLLRGWRARDAAILGFGAAILANSRPYEGLLLCVPVFGALLAWLSSRRSPSWRVTVPRLIAPLCAVALVCGLFLGYYNWRVTGNPLVSPYVLNQRMNFVPLFIWQQAGQPVTYLNAQFGRYYNGLNLHYQALYQVNSFATAAKHFEMVASRFASFFTWPELCVPLITLPWLLRDRRIRLLIMQTGFCFLGSYLALWFFPHYAAALTATVFALLVQSMRHLRKWRYHGRPVGIGLSRAVVLFAFLLAPFHQADFLEPASPDIETRAALAAKLDVLPGQHLVIVRYSEDHNSNDEWVYNAADIDHAKVVWAREIPGVSSAPLLTYFKDRTVWVVEPDECPIEIKPYATPPVSGRKIM